MEVATAEMGVFLLSIIFSINEWGKNEELNPYLSGKVLEEILKMISIQVSYNLNFYISTFIFFRKESAIELQYFVPTMYNKYGKL